MAGHADLAKRLIGAGASAKLEAHGKAGASPLSYALFYAKAYMGEVLVPVYPDNLRAAAALGNGLDRFVDDTALTPDAYSGLDFYAPEFFPTWDRTHSRQEVLDEALSWAARNDQCDSMAALVALGADVNANAFRGTPLLWACYSDRAEAAAWLLRTRRGPRSPARLGRRRTRRGCRRDAPCRAIQLCRLLEPAARPRRRSEHR